MNFTKLLARFLKRESEAWKHYADSALSIPKHFNKSDGKSNKQNAQRIIDENVITEAKIDNGWFGQSS